jgi:hypothetical protein
MELDASMLRPIVGHALDAVVALPVEWSVVPILVGDGQGLGVSRVSGSARVGGESRVVVDLEGAAAGSGVADRVELSGARGACLRTRTAGWPRVPPRCASFLASEGTRSSSGCFRPRSSIACYGCERIVNSSSTRWTDCPRCSAIMLPSVGISS